MHYEAPIRKPLIEGDKSYHDITVDVVRPVESSAPKSWWLVFSLALLAFLWGVGCILYTIGVGIGTWGLNKTVGWAWDITNFVWWVGIGHAGTLISAVLLLFRQKWRMSINRSAEPNESRPTPSLEESSFRFIPRSCSATIRILRFLLSLR